MDASTVRTLIVQLEQAGIPVWLDGGWGIDALLGRETRQHRDLDMDGNAWAFSADAFTGVGMVDGVQVRCLSAEAQMRCHAQGYTPTEKDFRDMELLQQAFGVELPASLRRPQSARTHRQAGERQPASSGEIHRTIVRTNNPGQSSNARMTAIDRLHGWAVAQPALRVFTPMTRVALAVGFLPSGLVKILGEPFTTLPLSDPVGFFFAGFFSAHLYYRFIGVAQWTAAGLLLIPRTATLGALLYLPIILNIFVITVAIGPAFAGTRFVTGAMLVATLYLCFWDWDRWRQVLPTVAAARRHGDVATMLGMMAAAVIGFQGVVAVHLARIRHQPYFEPAVAVAFGALLGSAMLVIAYRRVSASDAL